MILEANAVVPNYPMTEQAVAMHNLLNCTATASDREGIAFLIMTGAYIGFLPTHYASNWLAKGEMKALDVGSQYFNTRLALVTRQGRRANSVLETFLGFIDIE